MARYHYRNEDFQAALEYGEQWLDDQPFALDPALFTSYIACTLVEDQDIAIRVCQIGLRANRANPMLLNNLAFSLACAGRISDAREVMSRQASNASSLEVAIRAATRGLIAFREGNANAGRAFYRQAVDALVKEGHSAAAASATLFWVYEELRAERGDLEESVNMAKVVNKSVAASPDLALPRQRLRNLIERKSSVDGVADSVLLNLRNWRLNG